MLKRRPTAPSRSPGTTPTKGQVMVFFIITVAAAEVAVGLPSSLRCIAAAAPPTPRTSTAPAPVTDAFLQPRLTSSPPTDAPWNCPISPLKSLATNSRISPG